MIGINRILCPTDLSAESDEALRYAVAFARVYQAKLYLLHCADENISSPDTNHDKANFNCAFTESIVTHLGIARLEEVEWEGIVRTQVRNIGSAIVKEALNQGIDLIVMRSRRRPHASMLLGSSAETVCSSAPCPVLVTHPREREWVSKSSGEIDLRRILLPNDFSANSDLAMNFGLALAQQYQSDIHLLHVLPEISSEEFELAWITAEKRNDYPFVARKLQHAFPKEATLWCNLVTAVRSGKAHEEILAYATEHKIDLICMGVTRSELILDKLLGSNVDHVLRLAPCPVLVVGHRNNSHSNLQN